jgi:hypothetical protein
VDTHLCILAARERVHLKAARERVHLEAARKRKTDYGQASAANGRLSLFFGVKKTALGAASTSGKPLFWVRQAPERKQTSP